MILQKGFILGKRYEIITKIGAGGMAIVYQAKDTTLGRFVTVKVLREEFINDEEFISRFKIEAQSAASLSHPNIVNVYDVGQDGNIYYIVMEYIDGETLKELISKKAPFDLDEIIKIATCITSAIIHAHKNQIIHRDIKPQNILVSKDGEIKVTDFGIARAATASTISTTSSAIGSVHYFSPEQARGGYVDEKSDIYSLGILMFEMATGVLPFEGESSVTVALKHLNDPIPNVTSLNPNIPLNLEAIIKKATEKTTRKRYQTGEALLEDLKKAANPNVSISNTEDDEEIDQKITNGDTVALTPEDIRKIKAKDKKVSWDDVLKGNVDDDDEDYDDDDEVDKKSERLTILAAVVAALIIIAAVSIIGYNQFSNGFFAKIHAPYVVDLTWDDAVALADDNSLLLREIGQEFHDEIELGKVASQNKPAGTVMRKGDVIEVTISKGSSKTTVPNVTNKEEGIAKSELLKFNLQIEANYIYSDNTPKGIVIDQSPKPDTSVEMNSIVILTISDGKEIKKTFVPKLVGEAEATAKEKLTQADLVTGTISLEFSDTHAEGIVMGQTIAAGQEVEAGTIVNIIVSKGKKENTTETTANETPKKDFQVNPVNIGDGETSYHVVVVKLNQSSANADVVYDKTHKLDDFPFNIKLDDDNSIYQLYINDRLQY